MKEYLERTFPGLLAQARRRGAAIYFVDEAAVRSDAHRGTTWGKIGQTPEVEDSGDRFSLKMISAVSPRGDMKFQFLAGRMNGTRFVQFLLKLRADAGRPIIVITDNASYHGSGPVRTYVEESQGQVVVEYLPAYCPHLTPTNKSGTMPRLAWPSDLLLPKKNSKLPYCRSCYPSSARRT